VDQKVIDIKFYCILLLLIFLIMFIDNLHIYENVSVYGDLEGFNEEIS
jgi:hypothetical protein